MNAGELLDQIFEEAKRKGMYSADLQLGVRDGRQGASRSKAGNQRGR